MKQYVTGLLLIFLTVAPGAHADNSVDTITGTITYLTLDQGSKNQHNSIGLVTQQGNFIELRVAHQNPFVPNPELIKNKGKNVTCTGQLVDGNLLLNAVCN